MPRATRFAVVGALVGAGLCLHAGLIIDTATATLGGLTRPSVADGAAAISPAPLIVPTSPDSWFEPSGGNLGTEGPARFLADLALQDNAPLTITSGWGRAWGPGTSDHHASRSDSWAFDLAVPHVSTPSAQTEQAAARIASALGFPGWSGGNLVTTFNGYRFQLLWLVAGHFDHVHIGVRRTA